MRSLRHVNPSPVAPLESLVSWLKGHLASGPTDRAALQERLRSFGCGPDLQKTLEGVVCDARAFTALASRSYLHGNGFYKFELAACAAYKLRLHVWLPDAVAEENIHDHRWAFTSVIVAGDLTSEAYIDDPAGEIVCSEFAYTSRQNSGVARKELKGLTRLRSLGRTVRSAGEVYSMAPRGLHRVCVDGRSLITTLMLSEKPLADGSRLLVETSRDVDPDIAATPLQPMVARSVLLRVLAHLTTEKM